MRNYRQMQYRRPRTQVRLTEAELHQVINEAVQQVLIDEGVWSGVQNVGQAAWDGVKNMWGKVKGAYQEGSFNGDAQKAQQWCKQVAQTLTTYADKNIFNANAVAPIVNGLNSLTPNKYQAPNQTTQPTQGGGNGETPQVGNGTNVAGGTQPMQGGNANAAAGGTQPMQ